MTGVKQPTSTDVQIQLAGPPADPKLRQIGEQVLTEVVGAAVKALAHQADATAFPLAGSDRLERLFASRFAAKPAAKRAVAANRAAAVAADPASYTKIPHLSLIDFHSAVPTAEQLARGRPAVRMTAEELVHAAHLPPMPTTLTNVSLSDAPDEPNAGPAPHQSSVAPLAAGQEPILTPATRARLGSPNRPMTFAPDVLHALERSLSPQALAEIVAAGHSADQPPARNPIPGPAAPEQNKAWTPILHLDPYEGVEVRLIKMACVKETNGLGSDHIQLAGLTTSANGTTGKIAPFTVSDDFDDGEYVIFGLWFDWTTLQMHNDGPQTFAKFRYASDDTISQPGHTYKVRWPRQYWVTFLLCEIDNGGFPGFVDDVFNELKGRVSVAVAAAVVGATIGGTALSEIPGLGTAIGAAIGALLGWLLGEIWDALKSWWEDDEFTPITCYVTMQNSLQRFQNGTSDSAKSKVLTWTDMGSDYRLRFDWTVYQVH